MLNINQLPSVAPSSDRLGDLLVEAKVIQPEDLARALEYCRKTNLALGRVLIMLKALSENDLRLMLQAQAMIRFHGLNRSLAIKVITLARVEKVTFMEALAQVGWSSDVNALGAEPNDLKVASNRLWMAEFEFGQESLEAAALGMTVGNLCLFYGRFAQAEGLFKRAIEVYFRHAESYVDDLCFALTNLADLYFIQERFDESELHYLRALELSRKFKPDAKAARVSQLLSLAELHEVRSNYDEAQRYYEQCLDIQNKAAKLDSPDLLRTIKGLTLISLRQVRRSVKVVIGEILTACGMISKNDLPELIDAARSTGNPLGAYLLSLQAINEEQLQMALKAQVLMNLGRLPKGMVIQALKLAMHYQLSLDAALNKFGWTKDKIMMAETTQQIIDTLDHLVTLEALHSAMGVELYPVLQTLGDLFYEQRNFSEAILCYSRALSILEKNGGTDAALFMKLLCRIGESSLAVDKASQAIGFYQQSLIMCKVAFGSDSRESIPIMQELANAFNQQGCYSEAVVWYQSALLLTQRIMPDDKMAQIEMYQSLAACHSATQECALAEQDLWNAFDLSVNENDAAELQMAIKGQLHNLYQNQHEFVFSDRSQSVNGSHFIAV